MTYTIDVVRRVPIGGVRQKIHIRGTKRTNPVLLFLHGGPGVSNRDSATAICATISRSSPGISAVQAALTGA